MLPITFAFIVLTFGTLCAGFIAATVLEYRATRAR